MTHDGSHARRGGAPVGYITELGGIEAASVLYLRLWSDGDESRTCVSGDFERCFGPANGGRLLDTFGQLCGLCTRHGRRPLMLHAVGCQCLGADESCFANFIATAAEGDRDDAMLIATLLVRPDMAPLVTALATDFGLALRRMHLSAPREVAQTDMQPPTFH